MVIENKTPTCIYIHHEGDYAYFFINEWPEARHHRNGFTLTINSGWGCWGTGWDSPGEDWKEFLTTANDEYLMGKLGPRVFQADVFEKRLIQNVEQEVKEGFIQAKLGKQVIAEVKKYCSDYTGEAFMHELYYNSKYFRQVYQDGEIFGLGNEYKPELKGFFTRMWPLFVNHIKSELLPKS